jgi:hypothetical protein
MKVMKKKSKERSDCGWKRCRQHVDELKRENIERPIKGQGEKWDVHCAPEGLTVLRGWAGRGARRDEMRQVPELSRNNELTCPT